jgi:branched-chain amino acid aminotransferase
LFVAPDFRDSDAQRLTARRSIDYTSKRPSPPADDGRFVFQDAIMGYVWMNGRLLPEAEAHVPFLTAGLQYGMGVFEGIRCYATVDGPAVFRLVDHIDRLLDSARILGFPTLPWGAESLVRAVHDTIGANELQSCYVRPLVYLAEGGMNLSIDSGRAHVGIAAWPWNDYHGQGSDTGIRLNVSSHTRHHPNAMPTRAKVCGNYVNSFLAKTESLRLGFDDAVMLDSAGYVAECSGENLFVVAKGRILTPPAAGILAGNTRNSVIRLAEDAGLEVREELFARDRLYDADEIFLTGTAAEVVGVREVDFRPIGGGVLGAVTRRLRDEYARAVRGLHARSAEWLEPVPHEAPAGYKQN